MHTFASRPRAGEEAAAAWPDLEKELIRRTLQKVAGDRVQARDILGISQEELDLKIRTYCLDC